MPLQSFHFLSPFEKLFGSKPDVSNLRVFGCLYFTSTLKQGRSRFAPRSDPCVLMVLSHKKDIKFQISKHKKCLFLETLYFMRNIFLFIDSLPLLLPLYPIHCILWSWHPWYFSFFTFQFNNIYWWPCSFSFTFTHPYRFSYYTFHAITLYYLLSFYTSWLIHPCFSSPSQKIYQTTYSI